jgi:hypothetical protein
MTFVSVTEIVLFRVSLPSCVDPGMSSLIAEGASDTARCLHVHPVDRLHACVEKSIPATVKTTSSAGPMPYGYLLLK